MAGQKDSSVEIIHQMILSFLPPGLCWARAGAAAPVSMTAAETPDCSNCSLDITASLSPLPPPLSLPDIFIVWSSAEMHSVVGWAGLGSRNSASHHWLCPPSPHLSSPLLCLQSSPSCDNKTELIQHSSRKEKI